MDTFKAYMLRKAYKKIHKRGDKLAEAEKRLDGEAFRPIITPIYHNQGPQGGRPNINPVVMVKLLVLQSWYGLSDPELERQVADRLSFQRFLGFPDAILDSTTVWLFRERLAESGMDRAIWEELQRQLDEKGLKVKKGVVQDASFITSDPGHAPADKPRGEEARTRRSRDGSWTKKGSRSYYGFKLHTKSDVDHGLIRDLETTAASVHDSRVDLSEPARGGGVSGQGVLRRGDPGVLGGDEACCARPFPRHTGQAEEQEDQPEAGSWGASVCRDQAGVQCEACAGDDGASGSCEDGFCVFLF